MIDKANSTTGRPGRKPSSDDLFWIGAMRGVIGESIAGVHQAALGILALAGLSWLGLSMLVVWLLDDLLASGYFVLVLPLVPIACWALVCVYALRVFVVRRYRYFANSPDASHQAFERILRQKVKDLNRAIALWVAGAAVLLVLLVLSGLL